MKHTWHQPYPRMATDECARCGTTRTVIWSHFHRKLRHYVRPDGVRFTGGAPACDASLKQISRPYMDALTLWVVKSGLLELGIVSTEKPPVYAFEEFL